MNTATGWSHTNAWRALLTTLNGYQISRRSSLMALALASRKEKQVGKLVAKHLERSEANFSVGSRRKSNLEEHRGISTTVTRSGNSAFNFFAFAGTAITPSVHCTTSMGAEPPVCHSSNGVLASLALCALATVTIPDLL